VRDTYSGRRPCLVTGPDEDFAQTLPIDSIGLHHQVNDRVRENLFKLWLATVPVHAEIP
jgi:hypothetical protein